MERTSPSLAVVNVTQLLSGTGVAETPLMQFSAWYQQIHGYLSLAACTFGSTSNAMNIAVLTRRALISPTNLLLTALAVADLLTMVFYIRQRRGTSWSSPGTSTIDFGYS